jgi:hypothetical protein
MYESSRAFVGEEMVPVFKIKQDIEMMMFFGGQVAMRWGLSDFQRSSAPALRVL